jgi:hypothetical protein
MDSRFSPVTIEKSSKSRPRDEHIELVNDGVCLGEMAASGREQPLADDPLQ